MRLYLTVIILDFLQRFIDYSTNGEIARVFHTFFSKLYFFPGTLSTDIHDRHQLLWEFLSSRNLPTLSQDALDSINSLLAVEGVFNFLPSGKGPGPDRLTYLYYQMFREQLMPYLTSLYNTFLERNPFSATFTFWINLSCEDNYLAQAYVFI